MSLITADDLQQIGHVVDEQCIEPEDGSFSYIVDVWFVPSSNRYITARRLLVDERNYGPGNPISYIYVEYSDDDKPEHGVKRFGPGEWDGLCEALGLNQVEQPSYSCASYWSVQIGESAEAVYERKSADDLPTCEIKANGGVYELDPFAATQLKRLLEAFLGDCYQN